MCRYCILGHGLAGMVVMGWQMDLVISEVFSNLNDSVVLWVYDWGIPHRKIFSLHIVGYFTLWKLFFLFLLINIFFFLNRDCTKLTELYTVKNVYCFYAAFVWGCKKETYYLSLSTILHIFIAISNICKASMKNRLFH